MRITVLLGGDSFERDVSLSSSYEVVKALRRGGHEVYTIDPAIPMDRQSEPGKAAVGEEPPGLAPDPLPPADRLKWLQSPYLLNADAVFIALHGGAGEDGTVQALLDAAGVPYTGTGMIGSALAMNKDRSKALFSEAGIQTAPHIFVPQKRCGDGAKIREAVEGVLGFPVVVKPNNQGSSVGFSFVPSSEGLGEALERASGFGGGLVLETYIPGREVAVTVLEDRALSPVEIIPEGGFYDYKRKYTKGSSRYVVPAEFDSDVIMRLESEALKASRALLCRDYSRVDFRVGGDGETYCLEVNTLPGMTKLSLVPMAAAEAGMDFDKLVERICSLAAARGSVTTR